ncbi:hypothetical protein CYMTET_40872 [Cymbomonas tetramitiformis]|uniref:ATP-grasp domain-containing protein n=1 Tax=Cymbomonas tetramitiformis TaxID=36881 RepID=A0AAE0F375_9CHLO|nr:hypothetical protein CYMTET_40872 [Cymbomonas tetramitiformis]
MVTAFLSLPKRQHHYRAVPSRHGASASNALKATATLPPPEAQRPKRGGARRWWMVDRRAPHPLTTGVRAKPPNSLGMRGEIDEGLEVTPPSCPRPHQPDLHWFNANCEAQVAAARSLDPAQPRLDPYLARQFERDLRALPLLYCAAGDLVLLEDAPTAAFLRRLGSLGFPPAEIVRYCSPSESPTVRGGAYGREALASRDSSTCRPLRGRVIRNLRPWGWSAEGAAFLRAQGPGATWHPAWAELYSKAWSAARLGDFLGSRGDEDREWLCTTKVVGRACRTVEAVERTAAECAEHGHEGRVVIKAAVASSGRGQIHCGRAPLREAQLGWLRKTLAAQGEVVVEPWLDKVADLSLHFDVGVHGEVQVHGWSRFFTGPHGQYRGALVGGRLDSGLEASAKAFLEGNGDDSGINSAGEGCARLCRLGVELATFLGQALHTAGYVGPVGVDTLVYYDVSATRQLQFKPIVEINPRNTMGRVALRLQSHLRVAAAVWLIVSRREAELAGYDSIAEWAEHIEHKWPPVMTPDGKSLSAGAVFTNDPLIAKEFSTVDGYAVTIQAYGLHLHCGNCKRTGDPQ